MYIPLPYIIIFIVIVFLPLVGVIFVLLRLNSSLKQLRKKGILSLGPDKELREVQIKAQKMLEEASFKAKEIVSSAQVVKEHQVKKLNETIDKSTDIYVNKYQEMLTSIQGEMVKVISNTPKDIKEGMTKELEDFRNVLQQELVKVQEGARTIYKDIYKEANQRAQSEIENYKGWRLKQIDRSILVIIEEVSKRVLAKEISAEEHEKLVMKALEEAKRQNMF